MWRRRCSLATGRRSKTSKGITGAMNWALNSRSSMPEERCMAHSQEVSGGGRWNSSRRLVWMFGRFPATAPWISRRQATGRYSSRETVSARLANWWSAVGSPGICVTTGFSPPELVGEHPFSTSPKRKGWTRRISAPALCDNFAPSMQDQSPDARSVPQASARLASAKSQLSRWSRKA